MPTVPSIPFSINLGDRSTAHAQLQTCDYCDVPEIVAAGSGYYLLKDQWLAQPHVFSVTALGQKHVAYCLERARLGPSIFGADYYATPPVEATTNGTEINTRAVAWIVANSPDASTPEHMFALAGVPLEGDGGTLNLFDALAVARAAIWVVTSQVTTATLRFCACQPTTPNDCTPGAGNPKAPRLIQAVINLINLGLEYGRETAGQGTGSSSSSNFSYNAVTGILQNLGTGSCKCRSEQNQTCFMGPQAGRMTTCNGSLIPNDTAQPFVAFIGCPNDVRNVCGRLLIGPFMLFSSLDAAATNSGEDPGVPDTSPLMQRILAGDFINAACSDPDYFSDNVADIASLEDDTHYMQRRLRKGRCLSIDAENRLATEIRLNLEREFQQDPSFVIEDEMGTGLEIDLRRAIEAALDEIEGELCAGTDEVIGVTGICDTLNEIKGVTCCTCNEASGDIPPLTYDNPPPRVTPFGTITPVGGTGSELKLTLTPSCPCDPPAEAVPADFCGKPLSEVKIGQEFYLFVNPTDSFYDFDLCVDYSSYFVQVVFYTDLANDPTATGRDLQNLVTHQQVKFTGKACIHVHLECLPPPPPPEPEPWWEHLLINNNNNNNNDNNASSSNNNSSLQSLLENTLLSSLSSNNSSMDSTLLAALLTPPPQPWPFPPPQNPWPPPQNPWPPPQNPWPPPQPPWPPPHNPWPPPQNPWPPPQNPWPPPQNPWPPPSCPPCCEPCPLPCPMPCPPPCPPPCCGPCECCCPCECPPPAPIAYPVAVTEHVPVPYPEPYPVAYPVAVPEPVAYPEPVPYPEPVAYPVAVPAQAEEIPIHNDSWPPPLPPPPPPPSDYVHFYAPSPKAPDPELRPLLPEVSSAAMPDLSMINHSLRRPEAELDADHQVEFDKFYHDWYQGD